MKPDYLASEDGTLFRDLNGNGIMDPFEDPRLPVAARVEDLLPRLSLEEKAGLMFQTVIEAGQDGALIETAGAISKSPTTTVVVGKRMNHFNVHRLPDARLAARWSNALQKLAERTPHGIPVTVSTDPRHAFVENTGVSFAAGHMSQWPEPIGLGAIGEPERVREFADIVRQEYLAVGIRAALHPTIDLATEPRWGRLPGTLGADPQLVARLGCAYLDGLQGEWVGPTSVACTTKHFPGGGPQKDGEDAHFPYGREQTYTGGRFWDHLEPFRVAIAKRTSAIMPYYGMPVGLEIDGESIEEVGFGFNRQIVTGLLREQLGFDGVVVTDWELVNDNHVGGQVLPARAWGVEHLDPEERMLRILDAGADQFGGEECVDLLLRLVRLGRVAEERIDASARRLLTVKFELGLFDNPYVDEDAAAALVGNPSFREAGHRAQAESVTVLQAAPDALPVKCSTPLYLDGFDPDTLAEGFETVPDPARAQLALVRVNAPWEHRDRLFLESGFHQGSLDFPEAEVERIRAIAVKAPVVLIVNLDRAAILTPFTTMDGIAGIVGVYGASDEAVLDALSGRIPPKGRLPFELPSSMDAVREHAPDSIGGSRDALFRVGHGISLSNALPGV
ncbi:glycoside hydrolase family 3 N-terminal domain-containing protein [Sinomonas sp. JGH33]|uniref:beta-glucosidase n=1 Tax=Sinomonas terricola TaxID=3110330 RepID=A0ABU5T6B1_9MICC|nr:glycoside hydrolase family 3 N-terminal domain-containing protein [Sinomonas sp. JGH33]MEA5455036.1 glycoside hydrolase family 3 N-terminal domain-containing protein [Sinomonas sp. JGH33]